MLKKIAVAALANIFLLMSATAQVTTNRLILEKTAKEHRQVQEVLYKRTIALAKEKHWPLELKTQEGNLARLSGVDQFGLPVYTVSDNNVAANTTGASKLWEGGSSGLNLSGASDLVKGKMAIWDEDRVLATHVELKGRILQKDNPSSVGNHSTHVAGTLIGAGINPLAKGMAYGMQQLVVYDFNFHLSEIPNEAPNLLLSNHSYGTLSGWYQNTTENRWEFRGRYDENEDYKFGFYNSEAQMLDSIAYNAPYYLMVKSAGNNRNQNGPAVGQTYWRYNSSGVMSNAGNRPAGISSNDGYDIIPTYGNAKNILTIGAIRGINNGYYKVNDVEISSFSSWGPTDDGRIKPDLVADGVNVLSSYGTGDEAYSSLSGTSMATPNATGSLLLLQEYYAKENTGNFMRAATLKGLAIHTADEAGDGPGPDYKFGWGLLNVSKAAEVIKSKNTGNHRILENVLNTGESFSMTIIASGQGPLVATISWTDPKGTVEPTNVLNNPTLKLVNDLDMRITAGNTTYQPWILDPAIPFYTATKGDNFRDNVEKIEIPNPVPGMSYTITITHKNTLQRGSQAYSLILSGVGAQAYCTSLATNTSGTRIDSVAFGGIKKANIAGCTTYNNYTTVATTAEPNQTIPLTVIIGNCNSAGNKTIVKAFIDFNNNGSFEDDGEQVAVSPVLEGAGTFTTSIKIPGTVVAGNSSILRIVAQDATDAAQVNACGNYMNGETQDYVIRFAAPSHDVSVISFSGTAANICPNPEQFLSINVRNNGSTTKSNLPVKMEVRSGEALVANVNTTIPFAIGPLEVFNYSIPVPFNAEPGKSYTVKTYVSDAQDQARMNDTLVYNITVAASASGPSATAIVCGASANLTVSNVSTSSSYFWYTSPAASATAVGVGPYINTSTIPSNSTYYVSSGLRSSAGLSTKSVYPNGGGYLSNNSNYMKYTSTIPLVLESARLYSKYGGKVDISVIELVSETSSGYSYKTMSSTSLDIYPTSPNPVPGSFTGYDAADTGAVFRINLPLPAGSYAILVQIRGEASLFRNNNLTGNPYPFEIPGVISFYSNSAAITNPDPNFFQSFYYYLYDMKLKTAECVSEKTTVVAKVSQMPVVTVVNDQLVSNSESGNQWNLNGSVIPGAIEKTYKPTQSGAYSVTVRDSLNCVQTSTAVNFTFTAIDPVANAAVNLQMAPNPNNGQFTVSMNLERRDDLRIDFVNAQGQSVYSRSFQKAQGRFVESINLQNMASGVYMVKIQHGSRVYFNKIIIQR